ncbi:hypothetical protein Tco_0859969 [Tanacetum coccineum]|uniref:Uncharacterized protein n=1 Tax=Tanacetum coccineum TaxID=301880 RepID=A0ABQ5BGQ9_9ASTR
MRVANAGFADARCLCIADVVADANVAYLLLTQLLMSGLLILFVHDADLVVVRQLLAKLNPAILTLMASVKREQILFL